jgi:hypothetical protein
MSSSHKHSSKSAAKAAKKPLSEHIALGTAIESFVRSNCNFESSVPVTAALVELGQCVTLQQAFAVPLARQLFGMDAALRWALFLSAAPQRAVEEGDESAGSFDADEALALITNVYDVGADDAVFAHFEDSDDESDSDDEDSDGVPEKVDDAQ